jgi:hypothetical protein
MAVRFGYYIPDHKAIKESTTRSVADVLDYRL